MINEQYKNYNPNLLIRVFAEGSYDDEFYKTDSNNKKEKDNKKELANLEEMAKITEGIGRICGVN